MTYAHAFFYDQMQAHSCIHTYGNAKRFRFLYIFMNIFKVINTQSIRISPYKHAATNSSSSNSSSASGRWLSWFYTTAFFLFIYPSHAPPSHSYKLLTQATGYLFSVLIICHPQDLLMLKSLLISPLDIKFSKFSFYIMYLKCLVILSLLLQFP